MFLSEGSFSDSVSRAASAFVHQARCIHLVVEDELLKALGEAIPAGFHVVPKGSCDMNELLSALAGGDSMVWIGDGEGMPWDLSVGLFRPSSSPLEVGIADDSPLAVDGLNFRKSELFSAFISSPKEMPAHNMDEEIRADLLPILEARDRFGRVVGYPGILMSYYAPSLVGRRFGGSECFFFFFEHPSKALDIQGWVRLLDGIAGRFQSGMRLNRVETDYASYQPGERVRIRARVHSARARAAAVEVRFQVKEPGQHDFRTLTTVRRVPEGGSETEAVCDFMASANPGLWSVRVEVCLDPAKAEELAEEGRPAPVDRRDIGFVLLNKPLRTPAMVSLKGPSIRINGEDNFWAGTHYYPSSSWWEWLWRDFRPLKASRDFAGMRRAGYRIARVWIDPVLDETTLRAMDAAISLAAQEGIVLDICIFTQWVRRVAFERPSGERVAFDFRDPRDFNVYSFSLRHLELQREYVKVLAERWKDAGNIIYNLSNEVYVKDPDPSQMDPEVLQWEGIPDTKGIVRDTLLFQRWASEMTRALRDSGSRQPVIPGYMFSTLDGGDNYLGNQQADIVPWHSYDKPENTSAMLQYFDPSCSGRPLILEEFGILGWNQTAHYEASAHYALAAGAAAALSYEWGVSWLSREACFYPLPLRESLVEDPDPRWFKPAIEAAKTWSSRGVGICATPSGFGYGSIYHGTPFPASAAVALGRLGLMGKALGRVAAPEEVYVVIPSGQIEAIQAIQGALKELWMRGVLFGVVQESCLDSLPSSARFLLCSKETLERFSKTLERMQQKGIQVCVSEAESWKHDLDLPVVTVYPKEAVRLLVRRTVAGTLYSLISDENLESVTLRTRNHEVRLGVNQYALVQEHETGIRYIEASGEVTIDGEMLCRIDAGRVFLMSEDAGNLLESERIRILATEPMRIEFQKNIGSLAVLEEGKTEPVAVLRTPGSQSNVLHIDGELSRYVLIVNFARD